MTDELETIESLNILRAVPHKSRLLHVAEGVYHLRHEKVGNLDRAALEQVMEESGWSKEEVRKGFAFHDALMKKMAASAFAGYIVDDGNTRWSANLNGTVPPERLGHYAPREEVAVGLSVSPSGELADMATEARVFVRAAAASNAPRIASVADTLSRTRDTLYSGRMAEVRGDYLSIAGQAGDPVGIYFSPPEATAPLRVSAADCSPNGPSILRFVVPPSLPPGSYTVSVATRWAGRKTKLTSEVRTSVYEYPVTVNPASP